jgi:CRP/FNR family transcriptional regulator, anaerobic regulatory protein
LEKLEFYFRNEGFGDSDIAAIIGCFIPKKIPKGEFFVEEGKTSRYMGFVDRGFLQYYVNIDGEEKTTYSAGENNFVASLVSFLKQLPAKENIRAVVDTDLLIIERDDLKKLQDQVPAFKDFYVNLLEYLICCIDESRLDAIVLNAQERYEKMLEKEPEILQQIPLQYLASILGVSPRHLSRIRNNIR